MGLFWQVGRHSLIGAVRACQAVIAAIKITSRTSSDAGHMASRLTRTNCTSSQLPALAGLVLPSFCVLTPLSCRRALCQKTPLFQLIQYLLFHSVFKCVPPVCLKTIKLKVDIVEGSVHLSTFSFFKESLIWIKLMDSIYAMMLV